jgi:15-cis-phytoene synthase
MDAFEHCETLVRSGDRDRFLATLFAPPVVRGPLFALYAFNLEIARIREAVRDPLAGEIRLQWWSEILGGEGRGGIEGHPVAAALIAAVGAHGLPVGQLDALVDARRFDLHSEPMQSLAEFDAYGVAVSSNLIVLAAHILGAHNASQALFRHAGLAYAIAGLLKAFPIHARRGQLYLPLQLLESHGSGRHDVASGQATAQLRAALAEMRHMARGHLAEARSLLDAAPVAALPAFLPVAVTGPILARMEGRNYDPFHPVEVAPWRRQWLIWRAARSPDRLFQV